MLSRLEIRDFALIENIVLEPGPGLVILTGETGAGKSILIDAISVLCGSRGGRDLVRHGQEKAVVEAVFSNTTPVIPDDMKEDLGISGELAEDEPDLILSREIFRNGRSACRINGRMVPLNMLRDLAAFLVDIHGQHDQQAIFRTDIHLELLDHFGAEKVKSKLAIFQNTIDKIKVCDKELAEFGVDPAERERTIDILSFQVDEIEAARIKPGEDNKLSDKRKLITNAEKIKQAIGEAYNLLGSESGESVTAVLAEAAGKIESVLQHIPDLKDISTQLNTVQDLLEEVIVDLRHRLEETDIDPSEMVIIDERLDVIYRLKKKYGGSLPAIADFYHEARERLAKLKDGEKIYDKLLQEKTRLVQEAGFQAGELSNVRRQAAEILEEKVKAELEDLGMKGIRFAVSFAEIETGKAKLSYRGADQVEFLISANPGEPLRPLARIASGGEASRIMLAIKAILARADQVPTLIFDEIDAGVSGHTADRVAEKLKQLSGRHQVFCITHLAQIAASADQHVLIEKMVMDDRSSTRLYILDKSRRAEELSRLLSGGSGGSAARLLAKQMLEQYAESGANS